MGTLDPADQYLHQELERLLAQCPVVGRLWEEASSKLARAEALPAPELIKRLGQLLLDWDALLISSKAIIEADGQPIVFPDPAASLGDAKALVEQAISSRRRCAQRDLVMDRLSKVMRLEIRDGLDGPELVAVRAAAADQARRIGEGLSLDSIPEFHAIAAGDHAYCRLLDLVEPKESTRVDRAILGMVCTDRFGVEVTRAAVEGRLRVARPAAGEPLEDLRQNEPEGKVQVDRVAARQEQPPDGLGGVEGLAVDLGATPHESLFEPAHEGPVSEAEATGSREEPRAIGTRPRTGVRSPRKPSRILDDFKCNSLDRISEAFKLVTSTTQPANTGSVNVPPLAQSGMNLDVRSDVVEDPLGGRAGLPDPAEKPLASIAADADDLTGAPAPEESRISPRELGEETDVVLQTSRPADAGKSTPREGRESGVADREEILGCCRRGDYLGAGLLAAGRAFAAFPECDPSFEALLVAHHVASDSPSAPWPDWSFDPELASLAVEEANEAARLVLLAALNQAARSEFGFDPVRLDVKVALVESFNSLPTLRKWLDAAIFAIGIPGLWDQVCRAEGPKAFDAYKKSREAFMDRYNQGLKHLKGAYIHQQDHFVSRLLATRLLHDHLTPACPGPIGDDQARKIRALLETTPEDLMKEWLKSTKSSSAAGVRLRGNDRLDLVRRAATYLSVMERAWVAAQAIRRPGPPSGEVDRVREELLAVLPTARGLAQGTPWEPLFRELTRGLFA